MKKWITFLLFMTFFLSFGTESFSMEESDDWEWEAVSVRPPPVKTSTQEDLGAASLKKHSASRFLPPDIFEVPLSRDLTALDLSHKGIGLDKTATLIIVLPELPRLRRLNLTGNCVNACCVEMLNPFLRGLHTLILANNNLGDYEVTLLDLPPALTELDLTRNKIGRKGAEALALKLRKSPGLSMLRVDENDLGPEGVRALLAYPLCIRVLSLRSTSLGSDGARVVGERLGMLSYLDTLSLRSNGITTVESLRFDGRSLQSLDLGDNPLDPAGVGDLGESLKSISSVRELRLDNMALGDRGIIGLSFSEALQVLVLSNNGITVAVIKALAEKFHFLPNLHELRLENNGFGDEGVELLYFPASLRVLDLGGNRIGANGMLALVQSFSRLSVLEKLHLDNNDIGPRSLDVLADKLGDLSPHLKELSLSRNPIIGKDCERCERHLEKKRHNLQLII